MDCLSCVAGSAATGVAWLIAEVLRKRCSSSTTSASSTQLVVVSDPGQDLDDEMAYIMMRHLIEEGLLNLLGVVTTLAPSYDRARLCRGTLDLLGLHGVPVGVGSDGGDTVGTHKADPFEAGARSYMPSRNSESTMLLEPGRRLLRRLYQEAKPKSLTLLVIASLKDAAIFLRDNEKIFEAKTKEVVIMGGAKSYRDADGKCTELPDGKFLEPDDAHNQMFDMSASKFFFRRCQELGIRLIVVSRWAAYASKMPRQTYDVLALSGSSIGRRLRNAQRGSIEQLWVRACASPTDPARKGLPARCDRKWFINTFCGGRDDPNRGSDQPVWDLVDGFMQYDTMALFAAVPCIRQNYYTPESVTTRALSGARTTHLVIGYSKTEHNLKEPTDGLLNYLNTGFEHGLALNHHFKAQVILIAQLREDTNVDMLLACLMLRTLYACWAVECIGVVVAPLSDNHHSEHDAEQVQTMKKTLADVGLRFVPVLEANEATSVQDNLRQLYKQALPMGVTLVVTGTLTAAALFAEQHPHLFREKTTRAILMGGALVAERKLSRTASERELSFDTARSEDSLCFESEEAGSVPHPVADHHLTCEMFLGEEFFEDATNSKEQEEHWLEPDFQAQNNQLDMNSAVRFYAAAQKLSVPLLVISRHLSASVQVPRSVFEMLEKHGGTVGKSVCEKQRMCIQQLWDRSNAPKEDRVRRHRLPSRCDADWFAQTFCSGNSPSLLGDIWDSVNFFNIYSPLALLIALPDVVERYLATTSIQVRAATHKVCGLNEETSGCTDPAALQNLLLHGLVYGARYNVSEYELGDPPPIALGQGRSWRFDPSEDKLSDLLPTRSFL